MTTQLVRKIEIGTLDWDCLNDDTQYLTHAIHRYSSKFIPQIARQAIQLLTVPGGTVLDPYCGSGTTLLEAALIGRRAIGIDLNPLATLISRVKTDPIPPSKLIDFQCLLAGKLQPLLESPMPLFDKSTNCKLSKRVYGDPRWSDPWYRKWFSPQVLLELIAIYEALAEFRDVRLRNIGLAAFSDILRRFSNAHSGYPNVMFDRNKRSPGSPMPHFFRKLSQICRRVSLLERPFSDKCIPVVVRADAAAMPLATSSVDAVVTHPPYICSIPYAEYGLLNLKWLGHEPRQIDRRLAGGQRRSADVVSKFEESFYHMLKESHRVLKTNGGLFMLLGNPKVQGRLVDLVGMATSLAQKAGFGIIGTHVRASVNRRANLMGKETLLFFQAV